MNIVTIARQGWILRGRSPLEVVPGGPAGEVVCLAPHPRVLPGRGPRPVLGLRGLQLHGVAHEVVAGAGHDPEHGCIQIQILDSTGVSRIKYQVCGAEVEEFSGQNEFDVKSSVKHRPVCTFLARPHLFISAALHRVHCVRYPVPVGEGGHPPDLRRVHEVQQPALVAVPLLPAPAQTRRAAELGLNTTIIRISISPLSTRDFSLDFPKMPVFFGFIMIFYASHDHICIKLDSPQCKGC